MTKSQQKKMKLRSEMVVMQSYRVFSLIFHTDAEPLATNSVHAII